MSSGNLLIVLFIAIAWLTMMHRGGNMTLSWGLGNFNRERSPRLFTFAWWLIVVLVVLVAIVLLAGV